MSVSRLAAGLIITGLAACSPKGGPPPTLDPTGLSSAASLTSVPFHPQSERTDCGPAALAMMLGWTGLDTSPKALASAVYTPGRDGTLQADIVQATRRAGRLAAPVHDFQKLLAELEAGNPVLVLQNLGIERWPLWHYAVAVGYDLNANTLFLHSGKKARLATSFSDFEKSWRSSKRWGLTITRPDRLPATLQLADGLEAANGLEQAGQDDVASAAYGILLERWPDSLAALMGFGNARYAAGDVETAGKTFRHAVALHPDAAEAWNNLAVSLAETGRHEDALQAAREAVRLDGPNRAAAEQTLAELKASAASR